MLYRSSWNLSLIFLVVRAIYCTLQDLHVTMYMAYRMLQLKKDFIWCFFIRKRSYCVSLNNICATQTSCNPTSIVALEMQPCGGLDGARIKKARRQRIPQSGSTSGDKVDSIFKKICTNSVFKQNRQVSMYNIPNIMEFLTERCAESGSLFDKKMFLFTPLFTSWLSQKVWPILGVSNRTGSI